MRKKLIHAEVHGIKCDAKGCGWQDMTVPYSQYAAYLGRPCPKCRANLMTEADYKFARRMVRLTAVINFLFGWAFGTEKPREDQRRHSMDINLDGSGKPKITLQTHEAQ